MKKDVFIFLVMISIVSCNTTEYLEIPNSVYSYLPLNKSNKWNYKLNNEYPFRFKDNSILVNVHHSDGTILWGYDELNSFSGDEGDGIRFGYPGELGQIRGYYGYRDNSIFYYSSSSDPIGDERTSVCIKNVLLKNPLEVGSQWVDREGFKSRIAFIGPLMVRNKLYPNTVLVSTDIMKNTDSIWFAQNVGIVKKIQHVAIDTISYTSFRREVWELVDYKIK